MTEPKKSKSDSQEEFSYGAVWPTFFIVGFTFMILGFSNSAFLGVGVSFLVLGIVFMNFKNSDETKRKLEDDHRKSTGKADEEPSAEDAS